MMNTRPTVRLMALGIMAVSMISLAGYATGKHWMAGWGGLQIMAINTAFSLWLVALCLILLNARRKD